MDKNAIHEQHIDIHQAQTLIHEDRTDIVAWSRFYIANKYQEEQHRLKITVILLECQAHENCSRIDRIGILNRVMGHKPILLEGHCTAHF